MGELVEKGESREIDLIELSPCSCRPTVHVGNIIFICLIYSTPEYLTSMTNLLQKVKKIN